MDGAERQEVELEIIESHQDSVYMATTGDGGKVRVHQMNSSNPLPEVLVGGVTDASPELEKQEHDKAVLAMMVEQSSILPQCIAAYKEGIHGYGWMLKPRHDLSSPQVADDYRFQLEREEGTMSDEQFEEHLKQLERDMRSEYHQILDFFDSLAIVDDEPSTMDALGRRTRDDMVSLGESFWEILQDEEGNVVRIVFVPATNVRISKPGELVEVEEFDNDGMFGYKTYTRERRFRRYKLGRFWYKEFGDKRVLSRTSGVFYESAEDMVEEESAHGQEVPKPATCMLHWKYPSRLSVHGSPPWIGFWPGVQGQRESEETNLLFFKNNAVPPLLIFVRGGTLSSNSAKRLESLIEERQQSKGFYDPMIIEAVPFGKAGPGGRKTPIEIEVVPMTKEMTKDATFSEYMRHNPELLGELLRVPPIMRGRMKDFNRSTAFAAHRVFEQSVAQPARVYYDFRLNVLFVRGKFSYWLFCTKQPDTTDSEVQSDMLVAQVKESIVTIDEARRIATSIWNTDLPPIGEESN